MKRLGIVLMVILVFSAGSISLSQSPVYRRLYYNSVTLDDGPHFICQECGYEFFDERYQEIKMYLIKDFNALVAFKCPVCQSEYMLYVAIHKYNESFMRIRIQRSDGIGGIPSDWWNTTRH